jgi:type II secretory pathway predicted ATPase ExeA
MREGVNSGMQQADGNQMSSWLARQGWSSNPFNFSVQAGLFVGYGEQSAAMLSAIASGHKMLLLLGPTGSGKTTLLRWLEKNINGKDVMYLAKPPAKASELLQLFNSRYGSKVWIFKKEAASLFELPEFLAKQAKRPMVVLVDEAHEAPQDVLEWLRVLSDQVGDATFILSALPVFDQQLSQRLETLRRRVALKVELLSLTKEATSQLIAKRVESVGGQKTFNQAALDYIWQESAGFPREILRVCSSITEKAAASGTDVDYITPEGVQATAQTDAASAIPKPEYLPAKQRQILQMLMQPMTPAQVVDALPQEEYPGRGHAIRAVNNVLKRLHEEGLVERQPHEKTYVYSLAPKMKTIFVQK